MEVKAKIIKIENKKTVYYTIEGDNPLEIYHMDITLKMIMEVNKEFKSYHIGDASIGIEIQRTVEAFHKFAAKIMKTVDLFKVAKDPNLAPMVKSVYSARVMKPLGFDESYRFTPQFSNN